MSLWKRLWRLCHSTVRAWCKDEPASKWDRWKAARPELYAEKVAAIAAHVGTLLPVNGQARCTCGHPKTVHQGWEYVGGCDMQDCACPGFRDRETARWQAAQYRLEVPR